VYALILRDFHAFTGTWEANIDDVLAFIDLANSQGAENSIRACLRGFYRWAEGQERVAVRVHEQIDWVRDQDYVPATSLTDDEAQTLKAFVPSNDAEVLAHCFVALALGLGLKRLTALELLAENVRLREGYIVVPGRRVIPLPPWVIRALWAYRQPTSIFRGVLFITTTGSDWSLSHLMEEHTERLLGRSVSYRELRSAYKLS
jgi:integrase